MSRPRDCRAVARGALCVLLVAVLATVLAGAVSSASTLPVAASPTWSPNGNEIAFAYANDATFRIVTAPAAGHGAIRTVYSAKSVEGCCDQLLWSATGRILFQSNFSLQSVRPDGGKATTLASNTSWFFLSPNGATAAFDGPGGKSPSGIGLVDVSGGKPVPVPRPADAGDVVDGFSPDGTDLIFSRVPFVNGEFDGPSALMVEHVGGGTPVPLSRSGLIGASHLPADALDPEWSPDGRWIAFSNGGKLEIVGATGAGAPRTLAGWVAGGFSWSPTSKLIACFCGPNRAHVRFTTINPQGTKRTILWADRSLHYRPVDSQNLPQWSPDGSKLAFLARTGPGYPPLQVWVVGANGTGLKRIV
jgi:Tol biopolymer transport system component